MEHPPPNVDIQQPLFGTVRVVYGSVDFGLWRTVPFHVVGEQPCPWLWAGEDCILYIPRPPLSAVTGKINHTGYMPITSDESFGILAWWPLIRMSSALGIFCFDFYHLQLFAFRSYFCNCSVTYFVSLKHWVVIKSAWSTMGNLFSKILMDYVVVFYNCICILKETALEQISMGGW